MDAYILDAQTEIYVWMGQGCNHLEKQEAVAVAKKFLVKYSRPKNVSMHIYMHEHAHMRTDIVWTCTFTCTNTHTCART